MRGARGPATGTGCSWRRRGNHISERSSAIVNVIAGDLPDASMETKGLFAHVLPQVVLNKPRESIMPDITAHTRAGFSTGGRAEAAQVEGHHGREDALRGE